MIIVENIRTNELQKQLGQINLIDVREPSEYATGHIPTAKNIPMNQLIQDPQHYLDRNQEYYLVCQSGGRSQMVGLVLEGQGYKVKNIIGGTSAYEGELK